jgi:pyrroline-5-carboxylate reductase
MKTKSLGFIGGGRVVRILLQAFANKNATFRSVSVYDIDPNVIRSLKKQFPTIKDVGNIADAAAQDIEVVLK